ncbi:MAG TPA: sigma-70 family RNA polymerase sigma factor [Acidimicrobiia bacterium]
MGRRTALTDTELADAARRGDRRALDSLLERHAEQIHRICRRVLVDAEDARDATQEALVAIARGIGRYDGRAQFTTWMYRVATNAALDEARRRRRRPEPVDVVPERALTGDDVATTVTDRMVVDAALGALAPDYRVTIALREITGLEYAEIARVLDIPIGTVRSRIARARAMLADTFVEPPVDVPGNNPGSSDRPTIIP